MRSQVYSFSCLREEKEYVWDFRYSAMLRYITSQKSEDIIYAAAEAWMHASS